MPDDRSRLLAILQDRSVRFGTFTLASGRQSDFYVDGRQTTLHAEGAMLVARQILERLSPEVQGVGGMSVGADPIAGAVAAISAVQGKSIHGFIVRKEPKGHGTKNHVEGRRNLPDGSKVCVVEDTTTTGGSLIQAAQRCTDEGLVVVQTLTIVDREEGAAEALANAGYALEALFTRTQLAASQ
jgi:orotate phosphoribosyltransferase